MPSRIGLSRREDPLSKDGRHPKMREARRGGWPGGLWT
jgi:hypothetical protein